MIAAALAALAAVLVLWPTGVAAARHTGLIEVGRLAARPVRAPRRVPTRWLTVGVVLVADAVAIGWSLPAGVATLGAAWGGLHLARRRRAEWRAASRRALVADAVGLVCDELDAGQLSGAALRAAAEAQQPVGGGRPTGADTDRRELGAALRAAAEAQQPGRPTGWTGALLEPVRTAWRVSEPTGAPLAAVLRRVHADLLDRAVLHRERLQALAAPRSSALLLAGLPVVGIALGQAVGAHPVTLLTGTQLGRALLAGGVLFDLAGLAWTERLARS